ncbi:CIS tube protein [Chitinolyticbacter albus]|uniref:CIS tube protein n=1 Tax=Chitinolyticbacter albus TaxID=2961951 RepID=UPI00210B1BCF|nr:hypothetical protein [Chitinolyticbacter albus]
MELKKAFLVEISTGENAREMGDRIPVQFNPTSMRMAIANRSEGGQQSGRQSRQYVGTGSTTLTLELVFDSADEGDSDNPVPVFERTRKIEYFIKPKEGEELPPRVRFEWAQLQIDGVVESFNLDLDHFAADGTPLRAKVGLTIKAQDPTYQFRRSGPGATDTAGAPAPGAATPDLPGLGGLGALNDALGRLANNPIANALSAANAAISDVNATIARALDGESLAQFAQRQGLDPTAWRALAAGVADPLRLTAGAEIGLAAVAGPGLAAQGVATAATDTVARLGLSATGNDVRAVLAQGTALAQAGGVGAGLETLKTDVAGQGNRSARQAFAGTAVQLPPQGNAIAELAASSGQRNQVFSQRADPRATTFGANVPLRDRVGGAVETRANLLTGQAAQRSDSLPPVSTNPTQPAWQALPQGAPAGSGAHRPGQPGDCGCGCH